MIHQSPLLEEAVTLRDQVRDLEGQLAEALEERNGARDELAQLRQTGSPALPPPAPEDEPANARGGGNAPTWSDAIRQAIAMLRGMPEDDRHSAMYRWSSAVAANVQLPAQLPAEAKFELHCSFCGKTAKEVANMITSIGGAAICNECSAVVARIVASKAKAGSTEPEAARDHGEAGCQGGQGCGQSRQAPHAPEVEGR
jgi:hypothetical protein